MVHYFLPLDPCQLIPNSCSMQKDERRKKRSSGGADPRCRTVWAERGATGATPTKSSDALGKGSMDSDYEHMAIADQADRTSLCSAGSPWQRSGSVIPDGNNAQGETWA